MDIFGLQIRRLIQACCNGSILHSRDYYLLLACPGQFDADRNVSDIIGQDCLCSQVAAPILQLGFSALERRSMRGRNRRRWSWILRFVLSYSRKRYSDVVISQDTGTFEYRANFYAK